MFDEAIYMVPTKLESPINLKLTAEEGLIFITDTNEEIPLPKGAVFDGGHYGFLLTDINDVTSTFETQCPISAAEVLDGSLRVYEVGKFGYWKITMEGEVLEPAKFSKLSRRDIEYMVNAFGVRPEDIDSVNAYYENQNPRSK